MKYFKKGAVFAALAAGIITYLYGSLFLCLFITYKAGMIFGGVSTAIWLVLSGALFVYAIEVGLPKFDRIMDS
jgi:hypothetical protein